MPLMGFHKKKYLDRGVGGWVEPYPNYFWIFGICLTLQSPLAKNEEFSKIAVINFFFTVLKKNNSYLFFEIYHANQQFNTCLLTYEKDT